MFYDLSRLSDETGQQLLSFTQQTLGRLGVKREDMALTLLLHTSPISVGQPIGRPKGFSYNGDKPFYPASVIKSFYLAVVEAAIDEGIVQIHDELERAMHDMIRWSSNTATNYIIDIISQTTGDTLLEGQALTEWQYRRQVANRYFQGLGWSEMEDINICQKLMDDERYGREKMFATLNGNNHNRLTTDATARLFLEIFNGSLGTSARCVRMRERFRRPLNKDFAMQDAAQVKGFLGAGLPSGATLYSKAGWNGWTGDSLSSYNRHDAAYIELASGTGTHFDAFTLVIFSHGKNVSVNEASFPAIARRAYDLVSAAAPMRLPS